MKRLLTLAIANCLAINCQALALPRVKPPVPSFNKFGNCQPVKVDEPFDAGRACINVEITEGFGMPVDGNSQRIHSSWRLDEFAIKSGPGEGSIYKIRQFAYDCSTRKSIQREVLSMLALKDISHSTTSSKEALQWIPMEGDLSFMRRYCPIGKGFLDLNGNLIDVGGAIRSGARANVSARLNSGQDGVFTIDCQYMLFGFNKQPEWPIMPRSVAHEIYKRVCK